MDGTGRDGWRGVLRPAGLVDQRGDDRSQLIGRETVPQPGPQALHDQQVCLVVDPGQLLARRGDLLAVQVALLLQEQAHRVKDTGDRVGLAFDLALEGVGLRAELGVALGPAQVLLALVAAVHGVLPQLGAQPGERLVVTAGRAAAARPLGMQPEGPQRGGEVAAGLRRAGVEVPRHPDPTKRLDGGGEVCVRQATGPPVLGDDQRVGLSGHPQPGVDDDSQPRPAAARYGDDVSRTQLVQRGSSGSPALGPALLGQVGLATLERPP